MIATDVLIIGSGIIGLSIAKELNYRYPDLKILLLEKEANLAIHASGRNSGVLHAGFYYAPDTLKAQFSVEGNKLLTEYCLENNLAINRCGKVIVAKNEQEIETLYELKRRAGNNGVYLKIVDENQLNNIEPNAKTFKKALYSPTTSTINPKEIVEHLGNNLKKTKNVNILLQEKFIKRKNASTVITNNQDIIFTYLINTAGLYADKIAHQFGIGHNYTLIPFKGLYLEYKDDSLIKKHVYPVPDLNNPFLGTHLTKMVDGKIKIGPTAIPVFWRENYKGFSNFKFNEMLEVLSIEARLFCSNAFGFREIAMKEIKKYYRHNLISHASFLVKRIDPIKCGNYLASGIRAQLIDRDKMELVMDFVVEHGENSTHVLNAISPAFTCAFSFSKFIVNEIEKRLN